MFERFINAGKQGLKRALPELMLHVKYAHREETLMTRPLSSEEDTASDTDEVQDDNEDGEDGGT